MDTEKSSGGKELWDRLQNEPERAYPAFESFLSLPSRERTLLGAYRVHVGNPRAANTRRTWTRRISFRYGKITLEIQPWVPAERVAAVYRRAKREVYGSRKHRRMEAKGLRLIRFMARLEKPLKSRQLIEAWNATRWVERDPAWSYDPDKGGESSRLWRDYHRAYRTLAHDKPCEA